MLLFSNTSLNEAATGDFEEYATLGDKKVSTAVTSAIASRMAKAPG